MVIRRVHRNTVKQVAFTAAGILVGVAGVATGTLRDRGAEDAVDAAAHTTVIVGDFQYQRMANPARTVVTDGARRVVATLTDGARTANVFGPTRRFAEPSTTTASVTSQTWVRMLPQPWTPGAEREPWFRAWLDVALGDRGPDVLEVATQYLHGSPEYVDAQANRIRGDARFGVLDTNADGRFDRSDFYDYVGKPWTYPDGGVDLPDPALSGAVDDSGFVRLVFGYRSGIPLRAAGDDDIADAIPRTTNAIASRAPGAVIVPDRQLPVSDYGTLQPGDLVFFDTDPDRRVDLVGIYLGIDDAGHHRFVASREAADGPTMGDTGGAAVLDGGGDYSAAFRSVKRL
jgi:cell wall-associated NlpC family hydrolase